MVGMTCSSTELVHATRKKGYPTRSCGEFVPNLGVSQLRSNVQYWSGFTFFDSPALRQCRQPYGSCCCVWIVWPSRNRGYVVLARASSFPQPPSPSSVHFCQQLFVRHHHDKKIYKHQSWCRLMPLPLLEEGEISILHTLHVISTMLVESYITATCAPKDRFGVDDPCSVCMQMCSANIDDGVQYCMARIIVIPIDDPGCAWKVGGCV